MHLRGGAKPSVVTKEAVLLKIIYPDFITSWPDRLAKRKRRRQDMVKYYFISQQRTFLAILGVIPLSSQNSKLSLMREYFYLAMSRSCSKMTPDVGILICRGQPCSIPSGKLLACTNTLSVHHLAQLSPNLVLISWWS